MIDHLARGGPIFPEEIRKRQAARLRRAIAKAAAEALRPPPVAPSILPEPLRTRQRDKLRRAVAQAMADGLSGKIQPPAEAPTTERSDAD